MSVLLSERQGAVVRLTLNRPTAGNALDLELARALRESAKSLSADESCAVIVLQAEGPLFCGGGDVAEMSEAASAAEYVRELAGTVHDALLTLAESDKVLIGAVQGPAAGGGVGIVTNCDYVVASEGASFVSAYSKVGLSPDCGASYLMPRIVGRARAAEFLLLGGGLDAETAHRWGVVNAISSADDIRSVAHQAAVRVARMPTGARAATKRLLAAAWLPGYREHLENERDSIARLAGTEESDRLRTAFLERGGPSPSETRGAERGSAA